MFTMLVVLLAGFALSDRWLLDEASRRDLGRVQRYAGLARMLLEADDKATPPAATIERLRSMGLNQIEWLPANAPPTGTSPRAQIPGSSVEAWETVRNPDGSPRGYVRITRMQDTSQLVLRAVRWFTLTIVLGFAAILIAAWFGINRLICARIGSMAEGLGGGPDAVAADPLAALESCIESKVSGLQQQLDKARQVLDSHDEAACISSTDGKIIDVNPALCRILGRPREALVGTNRLDLVPASERTDVLDSLKRLGRRTPESTVAHRVVATTGATVWMRWHNIAVPGTDDTVTEVFSFGTDMTERQQLVDEIASLQGAFDQMQSLASTGSLTWDLTCDTMQWTAETFRLLSLDSSLANPCLDTLLANVAEDDRSILRHLFEEARNKGDSFEQEFRVHLPDGTLRFLQSRAKVRVDPRTKLLDKLTCTLRDITALRAAQGAQAQELRLRRAIEQSVNLGIVITDMHGNLTDANPCFAQMTGWSREELVAQRPPYGFWHGEHLDVITRAFEQFLAGQSPREGFELVFRRRDGSRFDVLILIAPLVDADATQIGWVASIADITSIQQTRQELRDANRRLAAALDSGRFGTFEHVYGVGSLNWNDANYEIHGLDPSLKDPGLLFEAWKNAVGDEYARLEQTINNLRPHETSCSYEFDLEPDATGERRRIRTSVFIERDKEGHPARLLGVSHRLR